MVFLCSFQSCVLLTRAAGYTFFAALFGNGCRDATIPLRAFHLHGELRRRCRGRVRGRQPLFLLAAVCASFVIGSLNGFRGRHIQFYLLSLFLIARRAVRSSPLLLGTGVMCSFMVIFASGSVLSSLCRIHNPSEMSFNAMVEISPKKAVLMLFPAIATGVKIGSKLKD